MSQNTLILTAAAVLTALASLPSHAAISVTLSRDASDLFDVYEYQQDFNSLNATVASTNRAWANDSTLEGWSMFNSKKQSITYYRASAGAEASGYFYSYGADKSSDRALGLVGSAGEYWGAPAEDALSGYAAAAFRNDSGQTLSGLNLQWTGEQWRVGEKNTTADKLDFRWGFGESFNSVSVWNNPGAAFTFNSKVKNTSTGAGTVNDGNSNGSIALGGDIALDWQTGQTLWITWMDYNSKGFDHGLAIDDVYLSVANPVTQVPELDSWALLAAGLCGLSLARRRRVQR